ncbi:MAG: PAS domain-containing protein [Rhizomicrobium sp.]
MHLVLSSRRNAAVFAHWIHARDDRDLPARADIDPNSIKAELPYVYIAQVMTDDDGIWFKFRLMGGNLVQNFKIEGSERILLDLQIGGWEEEWRKNLLCAVKMRMAVVDEATITTESGTTLNIEHLALPLSEDGIKVDRVLGAIDFLTKSEYDLSVVLPQVSWSTINQIELEKRIIISNLRIQL